MAGTARKPGDRVEWQSARGKVTGRVVTTLVEPTEVKGHHVAASADNPEVLVATEKTGAEAAQKPEALTKTAKATRKTSLN